MIMVGCVHLDRLKETTNIHVHTSSNTATHTLIQLHHQSIVISTGHWIIISINPLKMKHNLLYLKTHWIMHSTHSILFIKSNQLMLYTAKVTVYSEIHKEHTNSLFRQNVEEMSIRPDCTYSKWWGLKG